VQAGLLEADLVAAVDLFWKQTDDSDDSATRPASTTTTTTSDTLAFVVRLTSSHASTPAMTCCAASCRVVLRSCNESAQSLVISPHNAVIPLTGTSPGAHQAGLGRAFAVQCEAVGDELSANMHMATLLPFPLASALSKVVARRLRQLLASREQALVRAAMNARVAPVPRTPPGRCMLAALTAAQRLEQRMVTWVPPSPASSSNPQPPTLPLSAITCGYVRNCVAVAKRRLLAAVAAAPSADAAAAAAEIAAAAAGAPVECCPTVEKGFADLLTFIQDFSTAVQQWPEHCRLPLIGGHDTLVKIAIRRFVFQRRRRRDQ